MASKSTPQHLGLSRYQSSRSQLMEFVVTRQNQEFVVSNDMLYCDIDLVHGHIELVGDVPPLDMPSTAQIAAYNNGLRTGAQSDINTYNTHALNFGGETSILYGGKVVNGLYTHNTAINHGWANVDIDGLTRGGHFLKDMVSTEHNDSGFWIPSDFGFVDNRMKLLNYPTEPRKLEAVRLEQRLRVKTTWMGSAPHPSRVAMFAEDFADKDPSTYRNADGTIRYVQPFEPPAVFPGLQIPASCINAMFLMFRVTPRIDL